MYPVPLNERVPAGATHNLAFQRHTVNSAASGSGFQHYQMWNSLMQQIIRVHDMGYDLAQFREDKLQQQAVRAIVYWHKASSMSTVEDAADNYAAVCTAFPLYMNGLTTFAGTETILRAKGVALITDAAQQEQVSDNKADAAAAAASGAVPPAAAAAAASGAVLPCCYCCPHCCCCCSCCWRSAP